MNVLRTHFDGLLCWLHLLKARHRVVVVDDFDGRETPTDVVFHFRTNAVEWTAQQNARYAGYPQTKTAVHFAVREIGK